MEQKYKRFWADFTVLRGGYAVLRVIICFGGCAVLRGGFAIKRINE